MILKEYKDEQGNPLDTNNEYEYGLTTFRIRHYMGMWWAVSKDKQTVLPIFLVNKKLGVKEFIIFHFCINSSCKSYYEDNCIDSNSENKDEFIPWTAFDQICVCPKYVNGRNACYKESENNAKETK